MEPELPTRPRHTPEHAELCLEAVTRHNLGDRISIGGAFGLLHYYDYDYRPTDDVDAWWEPKATESDRQRVIAAVRTALETTGDVRSRTWGDVVSIELMRSARTGNRDTRSCLVP